MNNQEFYRKSLAFSDSVDRFCISLFFYSIFRQSGFSVLFYFRTKFFRSHLLKQFWAVKTRFAMFKKEGNKIVFNPPTNSTTYTVYNPATNTTQVQNYTYPVNNTGPWLPLNNTAKTSQKLNYHDEP